MWLTLIVLSALWLGCSRDQLPTQTHTVYDDTAGESITELVSVAQLAGVTFTFNYTRRSIHAENENDVPVRVRIVRADETVLMDKWVILAGWTVDKAVTFRRGETVTITVWHLNLLLTDPIREFSETVRL